MCRSTLRGAWRKAGMFLLDGASLPRTHTAALLVLLSLPHRLHSSAARRDHSLLQPRSARPAAAVPLKVSRRTPTAYLARSRSRTSDTHSSPTGRGTYSAIQAPLSGYCMSQPMSGRTHLPPRPSCCTICPRACVRKAGRTTQLRAPHTAPRTSAQAGRCASARMQPADARTASPDCARTIARRGHRADART